MNQKIWNYFEIAGKLATKKKDRRYYFLAALGIRSDGTAVSSVNGAPAEGPMREAHAEYRLSKKLDYGAIVYVARVRIGDGTFGMAKPCLDCQKALRSRGVKKVYYTLGNDKFGVLNV